MNLLQTRKRSKLYLSSTGIYNIPSDWSSEKLGEVIEDLQSGFASGLRDDNGVIQLRMNNITSDGRFNFEELLKVPIPSDIDDFNLQQDDVIFNNTNSLDLIGKAAIVKKALPYTFSNHLTRIRVDKGKILPYWLYLLLLRYRERSVFKSICNTHVGQSGIGKNELRNLLIFFPPLIEQQKIVSTLSKVDKLIQKTDQIIEKTQRLKKGLIQKLLTEGIGHKIFKNILLGSRPFKVPDTWTVKPLSEIARVIDVRHRTPVYTKDGFPLILPNNVKAEGLDLENTKFTNEKDYVDMTNGGRKPELGDIIYSRNASFGIACRVENDCKFSLGQDLVLIKPEKINSYLLFHIMNSRQILVQLERLTTGSTFKRINLSFIRNFSIPYPNEPNEENKISDVIHNIDVYIISRKKYLQTLRNLKTGLMQNLLTGKIRVKV